MWFQFIAYEQDLPFLKPGQRVEISVPSLPEGALQAAITFINPNMDDMTRSARIRVEVDNGGRKLRHRVYAQAAVHLDAPEALSVPKSAVLWSGGDPRLYVQKDPGTYEPRLVKLGRAGDRAWEILAGVAEGELVVTQGNMLIDGQAQLNQLGAPAAGEQPEASPGQPPLARDSSPAANPKQKCPVSGEELGSMGPVYIFTLNGTEFHLCCKACRKDIEKDPHKYLAGKQ
jgi:Cu(I)/Ag(I) efflux system membrane fusion protein